jgi:hypothetical protein
MNLKPRYSRQELANLTGLIYPEERRQEFTREPWNGEGFRHYHNPKVTCLEHYMPRNKPILPGALAKPSRRPPLKTRRGRSCTGHSLP